MNRRQCRLMFLVALVTFCAGCANHCAQFVVDTDKDDPVIYRPGSGKDRVLRVPLEGFKLECDDPQTVLVGDNMQLRLTRQPWVSASSIHMTAMAELDEQDAIKLGSETNNAYDRLADGLKKATNNAECKLTHREISAPDVAAAVAADIIRRRLPSAYSAVLRQAYNHQNWPKGDTTTWISIDMLPGMRLRVENSLPISPYGINSNASHPSSFAAPTYLYFHAISGIEFCDHGASPSITNPDNICSKIDKKMWESTTFLSASGGLERLGLQQRESDGATANSFLNSCDTKTDTTRTATATRTTTTVTCDRSPIKNNGSTTTLAANETSSLIDLLERSDVNHGAWRYWRLWLPAHRKTLPNTTITEGTGSSEEQANTPMLRAAYSFAELGEVTTSSMEPCETTTTLISWRCHSLHYRAVPIPEITIVVNGIPQWVPVGTTLADLLAPRLYHPSFGSTAPEAPQDISAPQRWAAGDGTVQKGALRDVQIFRWHQGTLYPVVGKQDNAVQQHRFLRLQLLPGDEIKWQ